MLKRSLLVLSLATAVTAAYAGPITILDSYYSHDAYANSSAGVDSQSDSALGFAPGSAFLEAFSASADAYGYGADESAVASDTSTLSGYSASYAEASASNFDFGYGEAAAYHYVIFSLDTLSNVTLDQAAISYGGGYSFGNSSAGWDYDSVVTFYIYDFNSGSFVPVVQDSLDTSTSATGQLDAGIYAFEVGTYATASASGRFASAAAYAAAGYNFTAEAVPEPASMAALGVGALALLRRRKKA